VLYTEICFGNKIGDLASLIYGVARKPKPLSFFRLCADKTQFFPHHELSALVMLRAWGELQSKVRHAQFLFLLMNLHHCSLVMHVSLV